MTKKSTLIWITVFTSVILVPTLCLLWFMEQAVSNERHSVQEQLRSFYRNRIEEFDWSIDRFLPPVSAESFNINHFCSTAVTAPLSGLIVLKGDSLIYPSSKESNSAIIRNDSLWKLEYKKKAFIAAAQQYHVIADSSPQPAEKIAAFMGSARCYKKGGESARAVEIYEFLLHNYADSTEQISHAIIALQKIYAAKNSAESKEKLRPLLTKINFEISGDMRKFMLNQGVANAEKAGLDSLVLHLKKALRFEQLSNSYTAHDSLRNDLPNDFYPLDTLYCSIHNSDSLKIIKLFTVSDLNLLIKKYSKHFDNSGLTLQLVDNSGKLIAGDTVETQDPFYQLELRELGFADMKLLFYLNDSTLFSDHIKNQTGRYIWIGLLTILFIIITGTTAAYLYLHHSNLNKLKNNFLATVTHELKTPIASCRILIETLLDEKVTDEVKVKEYYALIAQENQRLSRLVDNFLTFSRMERKRYLTDQQPCCISEICSAAVASMSVKFARPGCLFTFTDNAENHIIHGNSDALITVITNLLDNAYKYTGKEKLIELHTECISNQLIISVADNGIGIPRRSIPKLFNRFFQVNQKLSRISEGCGLGLTIVKYIVDSHDGTITVESQENRGSTFTIKLPVKEQS